jgi:hypothetical protein
MTCASFHWSYIDLLNNIDSGFVISFFTANNIRLFIISCHTYFCSISNLSI